MRLDIDQISRDHNEDKRRAWRRARGAARLMRSCAVAGILLNALLEDPALELSLALVVIFALALSWVEELSIRSDEPAGR